MTKISFLKESPATENRAPLVPEIAKRFCALDCEVHVETAIGEKCFFADQEYRNAGAQIQTERKYLLSEGDIVVRLNKPEAQEIKFLKKGAIHISYLDPFNEWALIQALATQGVTSVSMEMIPRTALAQKMDALSSQASLAGYVAVIMAADRLLQILPMMMTPAGTLSPSRVFVIGAGVAGLQAIATAKRLGARVEAFDTRSVVKEQVESLGAKFIRIDIGETGQTKDGYAHALTEGQLEKQREGMKKVCASADIVITTAQVFGKKAPVIVTREMVMAMRPGSVIVDLAAGSGGNVEGTKVNEDVILNGVTIIGLSNFPGRVARHASQMYAANIYNFVSHFWDKGKKAFNLRLDDEILKGCVLTHGGQTLWTPK